jgi:hypothetical protein
MLLAGSDDEVKPDTMICRFVPDAMGGALHQSREAQIGSSSAILT